MDRLSTRKLISVNPTAVQGRKLSNPDEYFRDPTSLSDQDKKYCRCTLHVAGKQTPKCLQNKAWFKTIDGQKCANPYSICAKSTKHTSRECAEHYNWSEIPDQELTGYANLNRIPVPQPYNRQQMLENIITWKQNLGKA